MTSSLVGSEMCIRDRNHTLQHGVVKAVGDIVHETFSVIATAANLESMICCLLYTSDAADDM
eukprot:1710528-Prorocentrum_lima.AAC.1